MSEIQFLGMLVGGLVTLGGAALLARKLFGKPETRDIAPQPLVVKQQHEYATKPELDALRVELMGRIADHERRNESDMGLIRQDLAVIRRGSDYVQRRVNGMANTLYSIAGKLGIVPAGEPAGGEG